MSNLLLGDETKELAPKQGTSFDYGELQMIIAGPLEAIPLPRNQVMLVDADGQRKQLAPNALATALVQQYLRPGETIAGPALVVMLPELDGGRVLNTRNRPRPAGERAPHGESAVPYVPDEQELQEL